MRRAITIAGFLLLLAMGVTFDGQAQCNNCNMQWPLGTTAPTNTSLEVTSYCMYAGDYAVFNVVNGETYQWTTCGTTSFDTQLTLQQGVGCAGADLAYNDDACGVQSTITWTANFTGQVSVLISQYNCSTNSTCMTLQHACTTCAGGGSGGGYNNPGGTINTCSGTFYDTGGPGGNYGYNENITTTFCPDEPGQCIAFNFTMVDIEFEWDYLWVHDGPSTASPILGYITGGGTAWVSATEDNTSGCLTFEFESDGSGQYAGWAATISCIDCDLPPSTNTDCINGQTICSDATLSGNASGWGDLDEIGLGNSGCLAYENQSSWYLFSPATSGEIGFTLSPASNVDYDFAIWGPYTAESTSSDICPPSSNPIRCSWASGFSTYDATTSYDTGIGHPSYSPPQFSPPTPSLPSHSQGAGGNGWVTGLTVTAGEVYVLYIDNWTANTTPFEMEWDLQNGATLDCAVLPVELLSFSGEHQSGVNILNWKTASEQNSDYFQLQRSDDGVDYQTLGTLPAQGHSGMVKDYSFTDTKPTGKHYYQLKQVDFNGSAKTYGPIVINLQGSGTAVLPPFPNPVSDNILHIPFSLISADAVTCQITNLTGQVLLQRKIELSAGNHQVDLNLESIASGMYHLRITDNAQRQIYSAKVVK